MKERIKKLIGGVNRLTDRIPVPVRKSVKVLTYAFVSTLLSFLAKFILTGDVDLVGLEDVVRTYGFNMVMLWVVLFRGKSND